MRCLAFENSGREDQLRNAGFTDIAGFPRQADRMAMPASAPERLRLGPFRGSDAVRMGLLSRRQVQGSSWRRLFHDV